MSSPDRLNPFEVSPPPPLPPPLPVRVISDQEPLVAAVPVGASAPLRRFCTVCGAPRQAEDEECVRCAPRRAAALSGGAVVAVAHADAGARSPLTPAIALYFTFLAISVVGLIAALAGARPATLDIALSVILSVIVLLWSVSSGRDVWPPLTAAFGPGWLAAGAGASVLTFLLAAGALWALHLGLGIPQLRATDDLAAAGYGLGFMVLLIAVQPAVIEELAFRGIMFSRLQTVLSPKETVVVSALMFMIIHLAVPSFPHLLVMGLALGWLRLHTRSLYPCMVLHFGHNLLCVLTERWRVLGQ